MSYKIRALNTVLLETQGLFRNFDDTVLEPLKPHVERLVADTSHDTHETSQRCAAEIIAGIIRGSKHWSYEKVSSVFLLSFVDLLMHFPKKKSYYLLSKSYSRRRPPGDNVLIYADCWRFLLCTRSQRCMTSLIATTLPGHWVSIDWLTDWHPFLRKWLHGRPPGRTTWPSIAN